jgi:hypothetical protein
MTSCEFETVLALAANDDSANALSVPARIALAAVDTICAANRHQRHFTAEAIREYASASFSGSKNVKKETGSVETELGIQTGMTIDDIKAIRKSFALRNHPDLCQPHLVEASTRRMQIANSIIDNAMQSAAT